MSQKYIGFWGMIIFINEEKKILNKDLTYLFWMYKLYNNFVQYKNNIKQRKIK